MTVHFYIQFHSQFLITRSCFTLINILLQKFDTSCLNFGDMEKIQMMSDFQWNTFLRKQLLQILVHSSVKASFFCYTGTLLNNIPSFYNAGHNTSNYTTSVIKRQYKLKRNLISTNSSVYTSRRLIFFT